jgi:hypothetical protein
LVKQFLADKCIPVLDTPPNSPDLAPWLLPIPQTEMCIERNSFWVCRWGEIKNGRPAEQGVSWWPAVLF